MILQTHAFPCLDFDCLGFHAAICFESISQDFDVINPSYTTDQRNYIQDRRLFRSLSFGSCMPPILPSVRLLALFCASNQGLSFLLVSSLLK